MIDLSLLQFAPEYMQDRINDKAMDVIFGRALERAEKSLPPERLAEYRNLFTSEHSNEEIVSFFVRHLPQFPQIVVEESFKLRREIAEAAE